MKIKKISLTIFSVCVLLALFASVLGFLGYVAALIIGGEAATALSLFIYNSYFPWLIRISSVGVGFGLLGMYLGRLKALSVNETKKS